MRNGRWSLRSSGSAHGRMEVPPVVRQSDVGQQGIEQWAGAKADRVGRWQAGLALGIGEGTARGRFVEQASVERDGDDGGGLEPGRGGLVHLADDGKRR